MALPIVETPKYETKIPSTGKKIQYRPYLVKEEKILMLAMESENTAQIMQAMTDVIRACTFDKIDTDKLCTFDLEYIFLKLRSKSVGEITKVGLKCEKCEKPTKVEINLDDVSVKIDDLTIGKIQLTDKIGVNMSWPKIKTLLKLEEKNDSSSIASMFDIVISCIESIYDDKKNYPTDEQTREEMNTFLDSLNQTQFKKIQQFIEKMPKLEHAVEFACENKDCKHQNTFKISGLKSFFE